MVIGPVEGDKREEDGGGLQMSQYDPVFVLNISSGPVESISQQPCQMNGSNIYLHRDNSFLLLYARIRWG